jgi:hypothetical protein
VHPRIGDRVGCLANRARRVKLLLLIALVHADLAAAAALALPDEDRSGPPVAVCSASKSASRIRSPAKPQHDDHRPEPQAVTVVVGGANQSRSGTGITRMAPMSPIPNY